MAGLYDIIAELRGKYPSPSASKTLDMVVSELGQTQENLREALGRLEARPVPVGGRPVLEELRDRASAEGVDDERTPFSPEEVRRSIEAVTPAQVGIAVLLGGTALGGVLLAAWAIAAAFVH
jgi:hypothetical protein